MVTGTGQPIHRALGLTDGERDEVEAILGRPPNHLELALFAVMWSEHCSYKSSRIHLRRLPTEAPHVLVGPGENAGVIDAGDGIAVAIRIESHNHPSAIEPYQGAATGVGGILRDIFTMGARPIAVMDPLFFGDPDEARQQWLIEGVVAGISGYGNSVGVPTVGGELTFDPCYAQNPLVNVLCMGVLPIDRLVLGQASGPGNLAVLLGSSTGRDGIGGVSVLASAGFGRGRRGRADAAKRPNVQVGDPYEEKRLIEACLELLDAKLVVGIQDLGGAGLVCATSETAARGGVGMDVDVSAVPRREPGMAAFEVMTSESQERMLAIVTPDDLPGWKRCAAGGRCARRWSAGSPSRPTADRAGCGSSTASRARCSAMCRRWPSARRPRCTTGRWPAGRPRGPCRRRSRRPPCAHRLRRDVCAMLSDPSWVFRQYDHQLFLNTVDGPGGDAAVLRLAAPGLPHPQRGLALTTDSNPTWCAIDPRAGTAATVAEGALNVACAGARPDGGGQLPQLRQSRTPRGHVAAVRGRRRDERGVCGPRSAGHRRQREPLQRERRHRHRPDPGHRDARTDRPAGRASSGVTLVEDASLVLLDASVGPPPVGGALPRWPGRGGRWSAGAIATGPCRPSTSAVTARLVELVTELVGEDMARLGRRRPPVVAGIHDVSAGGLGVALAELAVRSGIGLRVAGIADHHELFTEAPSRVVVCTTRHTELIARAAGAGVRIPGARARPAGTGWWSTAWSTCRRGRGHRRLARPVAVPAGRTGARAPCDPDRTEPGLRTGGRRRRSSRPSTRSGTLQITLTGAHGEVGLDPAVMSRSRRSPPGRNGGPGFRAPGVVEGSSDRRWPRCPRIRQRPVRPPPGPDRDRRAPCCRDGRGRPPRPMRGPVGPHRWRPAAPWRRTGPAVGQVAVEGVVDGVGRPHRHQAAAKWGRPDTRLAPGLGHHHLVGDGNAQRDQPFGQGDVASAGGQPAAGPAPPRAGCRRPRRSRPARASPRPQRLAGDLAPGDEGDAQLFGPPPGGPTPASESWSVRATALQPASAASSGIRAGGSLPSETSEWVWRSIIPGRYRGYRAAVGAPRAPRAAGPLGWSGTMRRLCG